MPRLVLVTWKDATATASWRLLEEFEQEPVNCQTIGWVIDEGDGYISVASTLAYDNDLEEPDGCHLIMTIPTGFLTEIEEIEF